MTWHCVACGAEVAAGERVGRRDACAQCGADLRACRQCGFHDPAVYNECREPQAERVLDRTHANFCEYFAPRAGGAAAASPGGAREAGRAGEAGDARARLDALFRKGR